MDFFNAAAFGGRPPVYLPVKEFLRWKTHPPLVSIRETKPETPPLSVDSTRLFFLGIEAESPLAFPPFTPSPRRPSAFLSEVPSGHYEPL